MSARAVAWLAGGLLVAALLSWVFALAVAMRPLPPALAVYAEGSAPAGSLLPVYAYAFDVDAKERVPFAGTAQAGDGPPAAFAGGVARVSLPTGGGDTARVQVMGSAAGAPALLAFDLALEEVLAPGPAPHFIPWTRALAEAPDAAPSNDPVYPLFGRARSSLPSEALLLSDEGLRKERLESNAAGVRLDDGRRLTLDRSGLLVEVPLSVSPNAPLDVKVCSAEAGERIVALVVDGRLRALSVAHLPAGERALSLTLPGDAREGSLYAVHVARTITARTVASAHGLVTAAVPTRAELKAALLATPPFATAADPLREALAEGRVPPSEDALRALLARLRPVTLLPSRVGPAAEAQREAADARRRASAGRFRWPFRAMGAAFAALAAALAYREGARRRALEQLLREGGGAHRALSRIGPLSGALARLAAALALLAALGLFWVLDIILSLVLDGPPG